MATIKAIESRSVHQIQSGQVIVDLSSVVKELVENSLDAGATSIEVRFKNQGLDGIDVQDNGKGIAPEDYETVALKHYTSKLSDYDDLTSLDTFGFRGEALSSLCALSKFHIITARAVDGSVGQRLDFDISGKLKGTTVTAAQRGTTVSVDDLFYNLPVRRKELQKNIKREYGKVISYLHAYACISVGVRFSVSNAPSKGKKAAVFSTKANTSTKDNLVNVYGAKTASALVPLHLRLKMQATSATASMNGGSSPAEIIIDGHISKPVWGEGRQAPDRQMYFVNSRPCALPQVAKAVNEVYKSFNTNQSPFVFANLIMDTTSYDVNVSPDKRTILLHDQTALLESLKARLSDMLDGTDQTIPQSTLPPVKKPLFQPASALLRTHTSSIEVNSDEGDGDENRSSAEEDVSDAPADARSNHAEPDGRDEPSQPSPSRHSADEGSKSLPWTYISKHTVSATDPPDDGTSSTVPSLQPPEPPEMLPELEQQAVTSRTIIRSGTPIQDVQPTIPSAALPSRSNSHGPVANAFERMRPLRTPLQTATITVGDSTVTRTIGTGSSGSIFKRRRIHEPQNSQAFAQFSSSPLPGGRPQYDSDADNATSDARSPLEAVLEEENKDDGPSDNVVGDPETFPQSEIDQNSSDGEYVDDSGHKAQEDARVAELIKAAEEAAARPSDANLRRASRAFRGGIRKDSTLCLVAPTSTTIDDIRNLVQVANSPVSAANRPVRKSDALTADLADTSAETKLSLIVSKGDFDRMKIVGQFNLGFILAVRPGVTTGSDDELFIIDQHAADEKYNYERLQRTTILQSQRLVRPKALELTAIEEETISNHDHALRANGFEIELAAPTADEFATRSSRLITLPISGEKTFDLSDLDELLHLLSELPSDSTEVPRPRKVQKMLAMRACRSSIMVGKTLASKQMEKVVRHMSEMEKPWNCPHGRPTMRHLASLDAWSSWREGQGVSVDEEPGRFGGADTDWSGWLSGRS